MNQTVAPDFDKISLEHRDCPLCKTNNDNITHSLYSDGRWKIRNCQSCGFVYIDKAPLYSYLSEELAWETTTKVEEVRRKKIRPFSFKISKLSRWRLHIFPRKSLPQLASKKFKPGNIIDVGCGDGLQLLGLSKNYTPHGIDVSKELAAHADKLFRKQGGYAIHAPALQGIKKLQDNFFSGAILRSYLEHETHPLEMLEETYRVLCARGIALIKVPNFGSINRIMMGKKWCGFRYPDHLNYFTPKSLMEMGKKCGFIVSFSLMGRLTTNDNIHAIFKKPA
jgi:SAM-dependent methyltransferase